MAMGSAGKPSVPYDGMQNEAYTTAQHAHTRTRVRLHNGTSDLRQYTANDSMGKARSEQKRNTLTILHVRQKTHTAECEVTQSYGPS